MSLFSKVLKASSAENLQSDHSVPSLCLSGNRMWCSINRVFSLEEVCWNELREDQGGDGTKESAGKCLHPNEDTSVSGPLILFVLNEQRAFGFPYLPRWLYLHLCLHRRKCDTGLFVLAGDFYISHQLTAWSRLSKGKASWACIKAFSHPGWEW